jgi:hypothetical protein
MAKPVVPAKVPAKFTPTRTDLANIDQQLKQQALADIQGAISKPTGRRIAVKKTEGTGVREFVLPTGEILGTSFNAVVVEFISYNRYYPGAFKPDDPSPPVCFAHNKVIDLMAPPDTAPEKQNDICKTCWANQWESDPKGTKGKACKNTRDLALMLESDIDNPDAPLYLISVSPTAIKGFDAMVSVINKLYDGPPVKALINIGLNGKTEYVQLVFSEPAPNPNYAQHAGRMQEAMQLLDVDPDLSNYVPPTAKPPARGAPAARGPVPRR